MRIGWWWVLGAMACGGNGQTPELDPPPLGDDDDDDDDDVSGGTGLPSVFDLARDDSNYCESQPLYNPDVPTGSMHWFGEMSYDSAGVVSGYEMVEVYPNPTWKDSDGIENCIIVWQVAGEVDAPQVGGTDIGLAVTLTLDRVETTCIPNPFEEPELADTHYNVALTGESTRWFFDSGTEFAAGYGDSDYLSWFFDDCKLF